MSISEKDAILREREAYTRGRLSQYGDGARRHPEDARLAAEKYPLPKVTRPRVVFHTGYLFRVIEGEVEWTYQVSTDEPRWNKVDGMCALGMRPTAKLVRLLADLLANPTEEVEA